MFSYNYIYVPASLFSGWRLPVRSYSHPQERIYDRSRNDHGWLGFLSSSLSRAELFAIGFLSIHHDLRGTTQH
jgi:hypothetical protein